MSKVLFLFAITLALAHGQSVKSCGAAGDKLANASFSVSPDPIVKGQDLTITVTGDLVEELGAGKFDVDLAIKALGIINEPVKTSAPFTVAPGVPSGAQKFVIGPFKLPSLPGTVGISGTVKGADSTGAPVFCVALDINVGDATEITPRVEVPKGLVVPALQQVKADPPVTDCSGANDHLHNRTASSSGGVITLEGDLDEDITTGEVDVALTVKVLFLHYDIDLNIPFSISPGAKQGHLKFTAGPSSSQALQVAHPEISISVNGNIKANDGNKQEIVCLNVNYSS